MHPPRSAPEAPSFPAVEGHAAIRPADIGLRRWVVFSFLEMATNQNLKYTTLVLGAGVSMSYDYPSGAGLIEEIKNKLSSVETGLERQLLTALQDNRPRSIDAFLKAHPNYSEIAKPLIAEIFYDLEDPARTRGPNDLYDQLVHEIPVERYREFKIITFNYGRSLEYFLAQQTHTSMAGGIPAAYKILADLDVRALTYFEGPRLT